MQVYASSKLYIPVNSMLSDISLWILQFFMCSEIIPRAQSSIDVDARRREIHLGMIPVGYEDEDAGGALKSKCLVSEYNSATNMIDPFATLTSSLKTHFKFGTMTFWSSITSGVMTIWL